MLDKLLENSYRSFRVEYLGGMNPNDSRHERHYLCNGKEHRKREALVFYGAGEIEAEQPIGKEEILGECDGSCRE